MSRSPLVVLCLVIATGCGGGGSPSRPTAVPATPAPTPTPGPVAVTAIDGWTHAPVAAAVTPSQALPSAVVSATLDGFLPRRQAFDGNPVALWPAAEGYVAELVYGWRWQDGVIRLVRWERPFVVTLEGNLAGDPEVEAKVREVLAEVYRTTGQQHTIGTGGAVTIALDPDLAEKGAVADASITARNGALATGRIRFVRRAELLGNGRGDYVNTLLHEMGHVIGLTHSPSTRDVMTPGAGPGAKRGTYTDDEAMCLHMMYAHRKPGNVFVDNESGATGATAREETVHIVD